MIYNTILYSYIMCISLTMLVEGRLEPTIHYMDKWKSRGGNSQRRQEKKNEDQRRERVRRKKVREKVAKSRNTAFFEWFVAPEGRKVGSLKRRVRSHLGRWEMNNCTPLWREAHFEVKMYKAHQLRSTFRNWDDEKVHAVVAQGTFRSQRGKKTDGLRPLLEVEWDDEKLHAVVAQSTFPSQKIHHSQTTFGSWDFYLSLSLLSISISISIPISIYLSIYLQVWERSYSAKLPQFLNLTSKTQQFCESSSTFELDNVKNEAILWDFLNFSSWPPHQKRSNSARLPSKMESWVQSWRPRTNAFCDYSTPSV